MGSDAMVMGDLVLLEAEVSPVMAKLIANGVEITAIHNHLLRAKPCALYMHVGGHGDPIKLATAIRAGSRARAKRRWKRLRRTLPRRRSTLTRATRPNHRRERSAEWRGVSICRAPPRTDYRGWGALAPAGPLGVATSINFQPTGGGKAAITGDFVLTATR